MPSQVSDRDPLQACKATQNAGEIDHKQRCTCPIITSSELLLGLGVGVACSGMQV